MRSVQQTESVELAASAGTAALPVLGEWQFVELAVVDLMAYTERQTEFVESAGTAVLLALRERFVAKGRSAVEKGSAHLRGSACWQGTCTTHYLLYERVSSLVPIVRERQPPVLLDPADPSSPAAEPEQMQCSKQTGTACSGS